MKSNLHKHHFIEYGINKNCFHKINLLLHLRRHGDEVMAQALKPVDFTRSNFPTSGQPVSKDPAALSLKVCAQTFDDLRLA